MAGISFKKMFDGKTDTVAVWKVYADGFNTLFYDTTATTSLSLPLDYLTNETAFTIEGVERVYHILFNHKSKSQFVSEECGSRFIVSDLSVKSHDFDSVRLVSNSLSNPAHVNIEIYRCPRNNIMRFGFRQLYMDTVTRGKENIRTVNTVTADYSADPLYEAESLSSILLPLNPDATSSTFHFNLDDNESRSFTINYQVDEQQILEKCGVQKVISRLDTVDNDFTILKILTDSIHDPPYTNVESYRCPTTNNIKMLFRQTRGSSVVTDTLDLVSLTADFANTPIYADSSVSSVTLPLNPNATSTQYSFNLEDGNSYTLVLQYQTTPTTFHEVCGSQIVFSNLSVNSSTFPADYTIDVTEEDVKFPAVNNLEVLH